VNVHHHALACNFTVAKTKFFNNNQFLQKRYRGFPDKGLAGALNDVTVKKVLV